jgi:5-hydroxyisourate hydrolase
MSISTHILDTSHGRPAANVPVTLWLSKDADWILLNETSTDSDGRCKNLFPESQSLHPGIYRIHFDTALYYEENHLAGLYPWVEIVFTVTEGQSHYHIPLLLTANGYTTYRGS